ncbi:MAG: hypothetical protein DRR08_26650 [Candidatus Parabeggiatoa sp. nov. 2]|nr:MAG: hypothetical protein B6247_10850 [Beggiatoa sp. 4572_84]RKZ54218.1 MAG: hypothetical protein DRR08_26650 [Gammaproteobacteria bacterium]HEC85044.1 DUF1566 domain-containing protein [Thioploca sp.]
MFYRICLFLGLIILLTACSNPDDAQQNSVNNGATSTQIVTTTAPDTTALDNSKRLALVIGNSDYQSMPSLDNPVFDAQDMTAVLSQLGFEVMLGRNVDKKTMVTAVKDFGEQLQRRGGEGLFYFSGHGLQSRNRNYLVPVDAKINSEAEIEFEAFDVGRVLAQMGQANNNVNLVILDACRDNPYKTTALKGLKKGLAKMDSPSGTLIAFATAPDKPSWGGLPGERNSIYTKHLVAALQTKAHWSAPELFIEVRQQVMRDTKEAEVQQVPWESVSLLERFCFGRCGLGNDERQRAELPQADPSLVSLRECYAHFQANRLITGEGGTAFACYKAVLEKEPTNAEALAGLDKIAARYADWVNDALNRRQLNKAKQYLAGLRQVNPNSPRLAEFEKRISLLSAKVDFAALLNPKRDSFETTSQFQARRQHLLEEFNQAAQLRDLRYQAGVAYLKDYDADARKLSVGFKWQAAWVKQFLGSVGKNKHGVMKIAPGDAQALWQSGREKPLFVRAEMAETGIKSDGALVEDGKVWHFSLYRYLDNGNGTVTDQQTGLIWLKNANCFGSRQRWGKARQKTAKLAQGQCGLHDGSTEGMWRLPTKEELEAIIDKRYKSPVISNAAGTGKWRENDAFSGVQSFYYWSSTPDADNANYAWRVYLNLGGASTSGKAYTYYVWPVRGGQ